MADTITFVRCFATFRGNLSTPPPLVEHLSFQQLVRFALDSKEPHPDVWFGARLPWLTQDQRAYVWCLGSDNLTPWIKVAFMGDVLVRQMKLKEPMPAFDYPSVDTAIMACLHRKPKF